MDLAAGTVPGGERHERHERGERYWAILERVVMVKDPKHGVGVHVPLLWRAGGEYAMQIIDWLFAS